MNTTIITAAGSGKRFNSSTPKQFLEILGKPVLIHTLLRFEACAAVSEIVVVVPADDIDVVTEQIKKYDLGKVKKIVAGGKTRAESVFNGFNAIDRSSKVVAVHDGARPLVSVSEIAETIEKAEQTGAACLTSAVTDTIKEVKNGKINSTLDRRNLRRALTPQAFTYAILAKAFAEVVLDENVTDECYLVEKLGYEIAIVEGSAKNIKITYPEDLALAEMYLSLEN